MKSVERGIDLETCYRTLQVERLASMEQIKAAYRRLARIHHPDLNLGNPVSAERFKAINIAYETLSNHLATHQAGRLRSPEQSAPKQTHPSREDWLQNEVYNSFMSVLQGNLDR